MILSTDPISSRDRERIFYWLLVCCIMVFSMVILGGAVRLTGSGLSMVDWNLLMGVIPPTSSADWEQAFFQYQQFPEYKYVNSDMSLSEFQFIYLMEWAHRVLGRLIGIVYFFPFLFFFWTKKLASGLFTRLVFLLLLGAVQGGVGWYMVKSGLVDDPHVSQYRLTLHFMIAVFIYGYMVRVMVGLRPELQLSLSPGKLPLGIVVVSFLLLMMSSGAMVAGIRAGFIFNTYPMMGESWVPDQLFGLTPLWKNFFENAITIQFVHRWLAIIVWLLTTVFAVLLMRTKSLGATKLGGYLGAIILFVVSCQVLLGIATLVMRVPVALGVMHQGGALILLTSVVVAAASFMPKLFHQPDV